MVMPGRIGDSEGDLDDVEEGRFGEHDAPPAKVIAHGERQYIAPQSEVFTLEQRLVAAAIGVGDDFANDAAFTVEKAQVHACGRHAIGGVEDMGGEPSQVGPPLRRMLRGVAETTPCVATSVNAVWRPGRG